MLALVVVTHQAVVARGLTRFLRTRRVSLVSTGLWIEVADVQRPFGNMRHSLGIIEQASCTPGAAFGRFVEQQQMARMTIWQWLSGQFIVLKLKRHLDSHLERCLQGSHHPQLLSRRWFNEQAVACVFDVRDHARRADGHRIIRVGSCGRVLRPVAAFRIEHKAELVFFLPSGPAQIDPPERRCLAIGEPEDRLVIHCNGGGTHGWTPSVLREAHTGFEFVPQPHAFLLIRIDFVAPSSGNVLHFEEGLQWRAQERSATLAQIRTRIGSHRMQVAARVAELGASCIDIAVHVIALTGRMTLLMM